MTLGLVLGIGGAWCSAMIWIVLARRREMANLRTLFEESERIVREQAERHDP